MRKFSEEDRELFEAAQRAQNDPTSLDETGVVYQGIVSARDGSPRVLVFVDGKLNGWMTPREAINGGTRMIQSAIEAERDVALIRACRKVSLDAGDDPEKAMQFAIGMLALTREYRPQADPDPTRGIETGASGQHGEVPAKGEAGKSPGGLEL